MKNSTNIQYRQVVDFNIPNLILPTKETSVPLGKWGMLHKDFLLKYKNVLFATSFAEGKLRQYLVDIDITAQQMYDTCVEQGIEAKGVTELPKEQN